MKIEVLFSEVCNLNGDLQNVEYLRDEFDFYQWKKESKE